MKVIDSNVLLDYPQIVETKEKILISIGVLRELDGLKKHMNPEIASQARRAAVYISRNMENIDWDNEERSGTVDEQLLAITKEINGTLITNDVYLKVQATIGGIDNKGYTKKDDYTGVAYYYIKTDENRYNKELDEMFQTLQPPDIELANNQYLVVKDLNVPLENKKDIDYETMGIFRYVDGELQIVGEEHIRNQYVDYIKPKNVEQVCLFDCLLNPENTIIYAGGLPGAGKSFLLNNYALQELEKGRISKIVYVPNNAYTENSLEVGTLPGELLPKICGQIGPLIDLIGIDRIQDMLAKEQLEIVPLASIRGRSFQNSIIIINEAQNLSESHIKLLVSRVGEGSRIFFDGDIKQADSQIFRNKNGLRLLLNLRRSPIYSKIFATVKLKTTERSLTAQAAQYLDEV